MGPRSAFMTCRGQSAIGIARYQSGNSGKLRARIIIEHVGMKLPAAMSSSEYSGFLFRKGEWIRVVWCSSPTTSTSWKHSEHSG